MTLWYPSKTKTENQRTRTIKQHEFAVVKLCSVFFSAFRIGGELPEGVVFHPNGTLDFGRPLSMSDGGTYKCLARNDVGEESAEVEISVTGRWQRCQRPALRSSIVTDEEKNADIQTLHCTETEPRSQIMENLLMIIVGAVAGGLLILMLIIVITITCHHKRRNEKLEKELTEKRYV